MALKDIFTMIKADRYTADGCEEIKKAQKAITEDIKYNNGDISQKTGLMKTPNGWVEPPKGKQPSAKGEPGEKEKKVLGPDSGDIKILNRAAKREWEKQNPEGKQQEAIIEKRKMDALAQKKLREHKEKEREKKELPSKKALGAFQNIAHRPNSREYIKSKSVDEIVSEMQKQGHITTPEEISEAKRVAGIFKELVESTSDAAPRQLTGDCKIRIKKEK